MRSASMLVAIQSLSKVQNSLILAVTIDPMCGDGALRILDFLPDDAVDLLRFGGQAVVKAENDAESTSLRGMAVDFATALTAEPRLAAEVVLFDAGRPIYHLISPSVVATQFVD